jgi:DNA-binding transcriptional LysR family regulator
MLSENCLSEPFKNVAWDDFRLVRAVAVARGLPGAADALGINHSTVFRRLGGIENALGIKLFERHRNGYVLTSAGEEMVTLADRLDDDITAFTRKLAGSEMVPAGELRVTTNDSLLVDLLTPLFGAFQRKYPDIQLDLILSNQPLNLSRRDADVAIRATDKPQETLIGRRAARITWALYGRSEDFPDPKRLSEEALFKRRWISLGDTFGTFKVVRYAREHVAQERIVYKVNTVLGLAEAVEAGLGIGHIPCFIADKRPGLRRLLPVDESFGTDLWLLTHPDLRASARVRVFLDFLAAEIAKLKPLIEGQSTGTAA